MYEIYRSLGDLMHDSLQHHLNYRPKETIAMLKAKELGRTLLNRAKAAQEQLFMTAPQEDRYFMWSDLKWQSGLYPVEEPKISEKAQKEARQWLDLMGGPWKVLEQALEEANLAWNWDPEVPTTWKEEKEAENRE